MLTSETIKEIAPAMAKSFGAIRGAEKDGKNKHFGSEYATLASALEACRTPMAEAGLFVVQDQGGITDHNTIVLKTRIVHTSGEWMETVCEAKPKSFTPQDIGSSITYLRRYGLMAALGFAPDDDDDGNSASQGKQQPDIKTAPAKNGNGKNPKTRKIFEDLQGDIYAAGKDLDALTIWAESDQTKEAISQLPADWQNDIRRIYRDEKTAALDAAQSEQGVAA